MAIRAKLRLCLDSAEKPSVLRLAFFFSFFFFFWHAFEGLAATVHALCMNSSRKSLTFLPLLSQSGHIVHYSQTHKFHFSAIFSLKMGLTVLFTHLKIILLQCFSVFSFNFQFSAVSKQTLSKHLGPKKFCLTFNLTISIT